MDAPRPLLAHPFVVAPLNIIAAGVILTGLIYGAGFLIPLVVAFLIATILEAITQRLARLGLPLVLALPLAVVVVVGVLAAVILVLLSQVDEFIAAWPRYFERLETLFASLLVGIDEAWIERIQAQLGELNLAARLSGAVGSAGGILVNFLLVLLYAGFLLAERGRFYRRLVSLGTTRSGRSQTLKTLDNISDGIRQYLFVKTAVSFLTGAMSYAVLATIGLDFAETWAVLTFLLNYIPSIGSTIAVIFPALLALVQFDTFEPFLVVVAILAVVQFTIGNVIEPTLMGRTLNLSPLTIIVALVFWSAVWGIAGAFLAVPITSALVILCREVEGWRWVAVLLSNEDRHIAPFTRKSAPGDQPTTAPAEPERHDAPPPSPT